jgi:hypothetical protein
MGNTWKIDTIPMQMCYAANISEGINIVMTEYIWYDLCCQKPIINDFNDNFN